MVASNLSGKGALPTQSYRQLPAALPPQGQDWLMVAGGESLGATRQVLYGFINPLYGKLRNFKLFKRLDHRLNLVGRLTGVYNDYPFIPAISPERVLYNSVGASALAKLPPQALRTLAERLQASPYVALRCQKSYQVLEPYLDNNLHLVPDCAMLLNKIYPKFSLSSLCSGQLFNQLPAQYIYVQLSHPKTQGHEAEIASQLTTLHQKTGLPLVGMPIGTAPGHADHVRLQQMARRVPGMQYLPVGNIYDIMYTIAQSQLYVGTSLHGMITAAAYQIPFVSLHPRQTKLVSFQQTWFTGPASQVTPYHKLAEASLKALSTGPVGVPLDQLEQRVEHSFAAMQQIINTTAKAKLVSV